FARVSRSHLRIPAGRGGLDSSVSRACLPFRPTQSDPGGKLPTLDRTSHCSSRVTLCLVVLPFMGLLLFLPGWRAAHHRRHYFPPRSKKFCSRELFLRSP